MVGRNSALEALEVGVPVVTAYFADTLDRDDRLRAILRLCADRRVAVLEVTRTEIDRLTSGAVHQGVALRVPSYDYVHPGEMLDAAWEDARPPLVVALDSVTDPHNLGAVIRSAAAFGAHGVVVPERRAAGVTASAWKASAGAAARLPVARATNLTRQLREYQDAGLTVVGLAADGASAVDEIDVATDPLVLVVGNEGHGLSRLVSQTCDVLARIPMSAGQESLNVSVAAGIALYEVDRLRRRAGARL